MRQECLRQKESSDFQTPDHDVASVSVTTVLPSVSLIIANPQHHR